MARSFTRTDDGMVQIFNRPIRWHLSSKRSWQWLEPFQDERGFPDGLTRAICNAISECIVAKGQPE